MRSKESGKNGAKVMDASDNYHLYVYSFTTPTSDIVPSNKEVSTTKMFRTLIIVPSATILIALAKERSLPTKIRDIRSFIRSGESRLRGSCKQLITDNRSLITVPSP